jgi:hypothetical protein
LQQRGELADFVEKEGAAVGRFKQAFLHCLGIGEGTLFMAEEFGFHQSLGDGRAVDGDERPILTGTLIVNRLGNQILAGAAFALNEDRSGFAGCNFLHEAHQLGALR